MNPVQMSQISEWHRLLSEMKQMKDKANLAEKSEKTEQVTTASFGEFLSHAVSELNEKMAHADDMAKAFEKGDPKVDLPDVMIAMQKANLGFQASMQVRNRFIEAYKEIMNMPV